MQEGDTGLYYMRGRYYDSTTGHFISRDPVRTIHPKEINPYEYASANPLHYIDPLGLQDASSDIGGFLVAYWFLTAMSGTDPLSFDAYPSDDYYYPPDIPGSTPSEWDGGELFAIPNRSNREVNNDKPLSGIKPDLPSVGVSVLSEGVKKFFQTQGKRALQSGLQGGSFRGLATAGRRAAMAEGAGALVGGGLAGYYEYEKARAEGQSTGAVVARTAWATGTGTVFNYAAAPVALVDSATGGNVQGLLNQPAAVVTTLWSGKSRAFRGYEQGIRKGPAAVKAIHNLGVRLEKTTGLSNYLYTAGRYWGIFD